MTRIYHYGVLSALVVASSAAIAADIERLGPRPLSESQLDEITAGGSEYGSDETAGGIVVANGSSASLVRGATISLSDDAGADARGLNLGNAAESAVSNAVNVWDGRIVEQNAATGLDVRQSNRVEQSDARAAAVYDYSRGLTQSESTTSTTTSTSSGESALDTTTMVDTTQTVGGGGLSLGGSSGSGSADLGGMSGEQTGDNSLAIPEATVQVGKGVALGGTVDFSVDSAIIEVGIQTGASITNNTRNFSEFDSGGAVKDTGGIFRETTTAIDGPSGSNEFTNDFALSGEMSVDFMVQTPAISMDVAGSGCFVIVGKCAADAVESSSWDDSTTTTDTHTSEQRGALNIDAVAAEYVVVDESSLAVESAYAIMLSGNAQQGAQALNLVNAAGSVVSNAVNIARTPTVGPSLELSQRNVVIQHR